MGCNWCVFRPRIPKWAHPVFPARLLHCNENAALTWNDLLGTSASPRTSALSFLPCPSTYNVSVTSVKCVSNREWNPPKESSPCVFIFTALVVIPAETGIWRQTGMPLWRHGLCVYQGQEIVHATFSYWMLTCGCRNAAWETVLKLHCFINRVSSSAAKLSGGAKRRDALINEVAVASLLFLLFISESASFRRKASAETQLLKAAARPCLKAAASHFPH